VAKRPLVHLIDGPVYVFRAYHSMPPMNAPDGTPTHAAYGFASTLVKYLADTRATHAAVAFDRSDASFRTELEPGYKAQRGDTPEDLVPQFEICARVAAALGVPVFERERYEADDLIATLAEQLVRDGAAVRIVTTDKDLAQLVREDGRVVIDRPRYAPKVRYVYNDRWERRHERWRHRKHRRHDRDWRRHERRHHPNWCTG